MMKSLRIFLIALPIAWIISFQVSPAFWHGFAFAILGYRQLLTADTAVSVNASTGVDNSTCLTVPQNHACNTLQYTWDNYSTLYDLGSFGFTINIAAGTSYTLVTNNIFVGGQTVTIAGAGSGSTTINDMTLGNPHTPGMPATIYINDVTLKDTGGGSAQFLGAFVPQGNWVTYISKAGAGVVIDTSANSASYGIPSYGYATVYVGNISVIGNAHSLFNADDFSSVQILGTVTFNSNVYSVGMSWANDGGLIDLGAGSYSGSATGPRALVLENGTVRSPGGLPSGLTAPVTFSGGQYEGPDVDYTFAPSTGNTVTMLAHTAIINPSGSLSALTIVLPVYTASINQTTAFSASISTTQPISTVTWSTADGSTVANGFPASLAAGQQFSPHYGPVSNKWYP